MKTVTTAIAGFCLFFLVLAGFAGTNATNLISSAATCTTTSSTATLKPADNEFNATELANATLIANIGIERKVSKFGVATALGASMQEAHLDNLAGGDRDSAGLFQMRPSVRGPNGAPYWGTYQQVTNPTYATNRWFTELAKFNITGLTLMEAAEDVENPDRAAYAATWKWDWVANALADEAFDQAVPPTAPAGLLLTPTPSTVATATPASTALPTVVPAPTATCTPISQSASSTSGNNDYPAKWADPPQDSVADTWHMLNRECDSFVAWKLYSVEGFNLPEFNGRAFGNAIDWGTRAAELGYTVDNVPTVGSVAWTQKGPGHVAWVYDVEGDTVDVAEYNYEVGGGYDIRTGLNASTFKGYIHFAAMPVVTASPAPSPTPTTSVAPIVPTPLAKPHVTTSARKTSRPKKRS